MEVKLEQNSSFEHFKVLDECCFLCNDGQNSFEMLLNHFKEIHYEDYNHESSIAHLCSCPHAIQLQHDLINHLLLKSLSNYKPTLSIKPEIHQVSDPEIHHEPVKRKRRTKSEIESGSYTIRCDYCPRLFTKSQSLQTHYNTMHDPLNPHKCNICSFGHCKTQKNLHSHLKTHEEKLNTPKNCSKCDKKFQTDLQLYHHMLTHREKILACDHCEMKFNMKNTLARHILTHFKRFKVRDKSREKKTLCQHCSRWISFYNLKRHIRVSHSESKKKYSYKCDFDGCGKSFTEKQTLKDHKNLHYGLKPYLCPYCGVSFPHIATLRRHKNRHIDPEKYKCEVCSECFVTKKSLTNHVQRQHNDVNNDAKPFACDYESCTSTFKYENYLQNHKRDVHVKKRLRVRGGRRREDVNDAFLEMSE